MKLSQEGELFYDTNQYIKPVTAKIFEFRTKRVGFKRRISHSNLQVLIINFEGIIGDVV